GANRLGGEARRRGPGGRAREPRPGGAASFHPTRRGGGGWLILSLALVAVIVLVDALRVGPEANYVGVLLIGPLVAAMRATPRQTGFVGAVAVACAALAGAQDGLLTDGDFLIRFDAVLVAGALAVYFADLGMRRERTAALLHTLVENAPVGLGVRDPQGRPIFDNRALAEVGGERTRWGTRRAGSPRLTAALAESAARVVRSGRPILEQEISDEAPGTGARRHWSASFYPVRFGRELLGVGSVLVDLTARKETEEALRHAGKQAELLATASELLGQSLDYEATLQQVADLAVAEIADWCSVHMLEEREIRRVAGAHRDPANAPLVAELDHRYPPAADDPVGPAKVMRTGQPELIPSIAAGLLETAAKDARHLELLRRLAPRSAMLVPICLRERCLGTITFARADGSPAFSEDDLALARELARRAATAIENARLYRERSQIAATLQQSLLPPRLPRVPGFEVAARYRPTGAGNEVGGDFYDIFPTPAGWVLAIGDVAGKGAEAAALTALARYTLRAAAIHEDSPARMLATLNEALLQDDSDRFCTVALALLDAEGKSLRLALGGHPRPRLVHADGRVEPLGRPGTLLGATPEVSLEDVEVRLAGGDSLVFYTDGVIEARREGRLLGEAGLERILERAPRHDPAALASSIDAETVRFEQGPVRDDRALLVLSLPERPTLYLKQRLPDHPEALAGLRAAIRAEKDKRPELAWETVLLLASEIATHAIRQGRQQQRRQATLEFVLDCTTRRLRLEVSNEAHPLAERAGPPEPEPIQGHGLYLVDQLADRWGRRSEQPGRVTVWFEIDVPAAEASAADGIPGSATQEATDPAAPAPPPREDRLALAGVGDEVPPGS
nr:SpoIIE family protein phosphatase [Actinomycetota bacterium]